MLKDSSNVTFTFEGEMKFSLRLDDELVSECKVIHLRNPKGKLRKLTKYGELGRLMNN